MEKTLINILGAGRSGTTMLDLMLGNDDKSFSLGEVHAWFRPFRKHHFQIDCNCGNKDCEYWDKIKKLKEQEFHAKSFDILNVSYLIDSSKNLVWMMDCQKWASDNNIKTINFLIYKPIFSYIYSIWKRGESLDAALYRYKLYHRRFLQSGISAYSISFDELVKYPETTLETICKITRQPITVDRKSFWEKEHHHLFGSGGIRKQSRNGNSNIIKIDEFTDKFKKMIPEFKKIAEQDKELVNIVNKLKSYDFNKRMYCKSKIKTIKPLWYYYLKYQNKFRSIFPSQIKPKF